MTVYFRFNCGNMWGLGHLYRNITLMKYLHVSGYKCVALINQNIIAQQTLTELGFDYIIVPEYELPADLINLNMASKDRGNLIFWDRLDSDQNFMKTVTKAGVKIISYDNYSEDTLFATVTINPRETLICGRKIFYSGPKFQILRPEIVAFAQKSKIINKSIKKVVFHFGGTDPLHILEKAFEATKDIDDMELIFISGKASDDPVLQKKIVSKPNAKYYNTVSNYAEYIYEADICMLAGGVSIFEAAAIGTPMINITHNSDQNDEVAIFEEKVGNINLGVASDVSKDTIKKALLLLAEDFEGRTDMSKKMKHFVPSNGLQEIAAVIKKLNYTHK